MEDITQQNGVAGPTPEEKRAKRAEWMHLFLVSRGAWFGCRDWAGLDQKVRDSFTDMAAFMEGSS